jgi:23S rRNA (pseudouridine1915-N3)-methyltransferase
MKITILAVGRLRNAPEADMCEDYLSRARGLGRAAGLSALTLREVESEQPLALIAPEKRRSLVVLDERGQALSSTDFARLLEAERERNVGHLVFLIGGADGLSPKVKGEADRVLSLGPMTWPHRLVRVMLAEQIYRAVTIMVNHPYHRS